MENEFLIKLEELEGALKSLRGKVKKEKSKAISKKELRETAKLLAQGWFSEIKNNLNAISEVCKIQSETIDGYNKLFQDLLKISTPNNLKTSYIVILKNLCRNFRRDFILPIQSSAPDKVGSFTGIDDILTNIKDPTEKEYMKEAIGCAKKGFRRAAAILGWCSTIDRIHHKIEKIGFQTFNMTQVQLASQQEGRFKKFKTVKNVNSLNELRTELFDSEILWIIEGMGLIDSNQHTRLRSCYDMRSQSAHPGDAPITDPNLLSFFSDINEIVFKNQKFQI